MQIHWSHILFAIIIGYVLGMYFPQIGATVKAKIGAA
jgi:Na+/H+-dicarboxylate symporter